MTALCRSTGSTNRDPAVCALTTPPGLDFNLPIESHWGQVMLLGASRIRLNTKMSVQCLLIATVIILNRLATAFKSVASIAAIWRKLRNAFNAVLVDPDHVYLKLVALNR
jgi:hypothetical protein